MCLYRTDAEKDKRRPWRRFEETSLDVSKNVSTCYCAHIHPLFLIQYLPKKDKLYKHPAINYGPEYRAQQECVVLDKFKE